MRTEREDRGNRGSVKDLLHYRSWAAGLQAEMCACPVGTSRATHMREGGGAAAGTEPCGRLPGRAQAGRLMQTCSACNPSLGRAGQTTALRLPSSAACLLPIPMPFNFSVDHLRLRASTGTITRHFTWKLPRTPHLCIRLRQLQQCKPISSVISSIIYLWNKPCLSSPQKQKTFPRFFVVSNLTTHA